MPPKIKTTKDKIISTALQMVRESGADSINARDLAAVIGCSTQPIFSNFASMTELRLALVEKADELYQQYMQKEIDGGKYPVYKATGMAYIRFAKDEKELFKLLFMRDRTKETYCVETKLNDQMNEVVQSATGLDDSGAQLFHLEMWAVVHGIATMFATDYLDLDWDLVSKMLTDSYQGLRKQYGME